MLKKKAPDEKEVRQKLVDRPAPNRGTPAGGPNPFSSASTSTSNSGADLLEERKDSILVRLLLSSGLEYCMLMSTSLLDPAVQPTSSSLSLSLSVCSSKRLSRMHS